MPGNVGDMGGMIASALSVYGKVTEGQAKALATKAVAPAESSQHQREKPAAEDKQQAKSEQEGKSANGTQEQQPGQTPASFEPTNKVAESVLQGFEETRGS